MRSLHNYVDQVSNAHLHGIFQQRNRLHQMLSIQRLFADDQQIVALLDHFSYTLVQLVQTRDYRRAETNVQL